MNLKKFLLESYLNELSNNQDDSTYILSPNNFEHNLPPDKIQKIEEKLTIFVDVKKYLSSKEGKQNILSNKIDTSILEQIIVRYYTYLNYWSKIEKKDKMNWEKIKEKLYEKYQYSSFGSILFENIVLNSENEIKIVNDIYIYIEGWKNQTVNLDQWYKYNFLNIWDFIEDTPVDPIIDCQRKLLNEFISNNIFKLNNQIANACNPLELKQLRLTLIGELFDDKEISDSNKAELKLLLNLGELQIPEILNEYPKYLEKGFKPKYNQLFYKNLLELSSEPNVLVNILFEHLLFLKDYLEVRDNRAIQNKPKNKIKTNIPSFTYIGLSKTPYKLEDLFKDLKNISLIDCNLNEFKRIFSGKEITKKIKWLGSYNSLRYFILQLKNQNKINTVANKTHWQIAIKCFLDSNENSFTINQIGKNNEIPGNHEVFENIVSKL